MGKKLTTRTHHCIFPLFQYSNGFLIPLFQYLPVWRLRNTLAKSEPIARSRGSDRCACQNMWWCLLSPRRFYDAYCPMACFLSIYEGAAFVPAFLCGIPRITAEGGFHPADFGGAHRSEPPLHMPIYSHYFRDITPIRGLPVSLPGRRPGPPSSPPGLATGWARENRPAGAPAPSPGPGIQPAL